MKLRNTAIATMLAAGMCNTAQAQLVINEIMQSNIDCVMDDINEFPDSWVELYNAGNSMDFAVENCEAWRLCHGVL